MRPSSFVVCACRAACSMTPPPETKRSTTSCQWWGGARTARGPRTGPCETGTQALDVSLTLLPLSVLFVTPRPLFPARFSLFVVSVLISSWGAYWGEMGFFRLKRNENQLGVETLCSWATPLAFTQRNQPCDVDGANCAAAAWVVDPSVDVDAFRAARGLGSR